jgi:hypothetical protein
MITVTILARGHHQIEDSFWYGCSTDTSGDEVKFTKWSYRNIWGCRLIVVFKFGKVEHMGGKDYQAHAGQPLCTHLHYPNARKFGTPPVCVKVSKLETLPPIQELWKDVVLGQVLNIEQRGHKKLFL